MQGSAGGEAAIRSVAQLARLVQQQALVMTYSDLFWIFGVIVVCTIPLAFAQAVTQGGAPCNALIPCA